MAAQYLEPAHDRTHEHVLDRETGQWMTLIQYMGEGDYGTVIEQKRVGLKLKLAGGELRYVCPICEKAMTLASLPVRERNVQRFYFRHQDRNNPCADEHGLSARAICARRFVYLLMAAYSAKRGEVVACGLDNFMSLANKKLAARTVPWDQRADHQFEAWPLMCRNNVTPTRYPRRDVAMAKDRLFGCVAAMALMALMAGPAGAQPTDAYRQALLIGVWEYEHELELGPMDVDLHTLSAMFGQMHFDRIVSLPNPTQQQIESAIADAVQVASSVGGDRAVLTVVYFGGHGTMVDNTSYLLAKDFVQPAEPASIIISGGIRSDYVGEQLSQIGQPALLIVEACRNPFVPHDAVSEADGGDESGDRPDAEVDEVEPQPMIALPRTYPSYITLFGQTPGKLVEIAPRGVDESTVLVGALRDLAPHFGSIPALGSAVRLRVMEATRGQRHPMEPHMDARGGGEIHLYYDDIERVADGRQWNETQARGNAELVRMFLSAYPTSPHVPVAKRWLREHAVTVGEQPREYVAYTRSINAILGRRSPIWERVRPVVIDQNVQTDAGVISGEQVEALRRLPGPDQGYQGRTVEGRSFRVSGPLPSRYDVSRVAAFWSDQATSVGCSAAEIETGQCESIEQMAELARNQASEQVGTLYVAAVLDPTYPVADTLAQATAIDTRLEALGVPRSAVAFRHFFKAELADATAPILIKRGDGNLLHEPE